MTNKITKIIPIQKKEKITEKSIVTYSSSSASVLAGTAPIATANRAEAERRKARCDSSAGLKTAAVG